MYRCPAQMLETIHFMTARERMIQVKMFLLLILDDMATKINEINFAMFVVMITYSMSARTGSK